MEDSIASAIEQNFYIRDFACNLPEYIMLTTGKRTAITTKNCEWVIGDYVRINKPRTALKSYFKITDIYYFQDIAIVSIFLKYRQD
jgi:tRNA(Ser,Leu) C12 N-acetylase TAN1